MPSSLVSSSYFEDKINSKQNEEAVNTYLQKGNNALASGNLHSAGRSYEACLRLEPNQRYCLINYASALVDLNVEEEDESIKQQRTKKAKEMLKHVLSLHPNDGDAAFNLALLLQDSSTSDEVTKEAARLYEIAVAAADNDGEERWDALANMAAAKQEVGEFMGRYGARRAYERAIVLLEKIAQQNEAYMNQGGTFQEGEQQHLQAELQAINEYLSKLYYGYGTVLSELSASDCQKLQLGSEESLLIDWVEPFVKGSGSEKEHRKDEASPNYVCKMNAINALRLAVDLNQNNVVAEHMLAAMTEGQIDSGRASNEFVSALFDDFADTFDAKLEALGYKVPGLVGEAADELLAISGQSSYRSALDAGCGTGLAGRFLRPLVSGQLVGIDLSKKMLDLAAKCTLSKGCGLKDENAADDDGDKPLYDHLASLDLEMTTLKDLDAGVGFDIIVAADVFVYFGELSKLLSNFAKLADSSGEHGAFLIFSCERIEEEEGSMWKLQKSGRYAHSKSYVVNTAANAGWLLVGYDEITPRYEKGEAVKGHLFRFSLGKDLDAMDEL